ncbi:TPA: dUTP diphosphatase [Candidatus Woesearchaeota archaeon]|nr:dUTP diphosphatase [Candidatus Woesearchaeota archaeon]HII69523.1 dUTP diphosphatase [Candidatus Woesearchaeota archaeon]
MITVKIKKVREYALIPQYAHTADAGVDLYAAEAMTAPAGGQVLVPTGLAMAIPEGYEGQVRPKSGLALKHSLTLTNTPGTVDSHYRGEIQIIVFNLGKKEYVIEKGTKIAQMVFNKVEHATFTEVDELDTTQRGKGGFGSTGIK